MTKNTALQITVLAASLLTAASCATRQAVSTPEDLSSVLNTIAVGESRYVEVVGELRPYSGSFPKGRGLTELAVGSRHLLLHHTAHSKDELVESHLNTTVSAQVRISHFPLSDSHPASQIAGHWITEIKSIRTAE